MTRLVTVLLAGSLLAMSAGCKQTKEDAPPTETTTQNETDSTTTDTAEPAEEGDSSAIPAPPNVAAAPADAETSDSGLAWIVLEQGDGQGSPTSESTITVHYTGWTTAGEMFDSSVARGEPIEFPLSKLIKGWQEGIPMMTRGEKRRFWIPSELAYGNSTRAGVPKGLLVFDIELIDYGLGQETPMIQPKE